MTHQSPNFFMDMLNILNSVCDLRCQVEQRLKNLA